MIYDLPLALLALLALPAVHGFLLPPNDYEWTPVPRESHPRKRENKAETNPNGSEYVWVLEDTYAGQHFFDNMTFWTAPDPTKSVSYKDADFAFKNGLAWIEPDGRVRMKTDNTTWLAEGAFRNSVRIQSNKLYNGGLFVLDLNRAPWGCAIWPAWWTVGTPTWPAQGEIDIIEGVHDQEHNQVAFHTSPDCFMDKNVTVNGNILTHPGDTDQKAVCDGNANQNSGCATTQWSKASYGSTFEASGGGAFVMKWDENSIDVWSFYRQAIPQDLRDGHPTPSNWDIPVARLTPKYCDFSKSFWNHTIVFDITLCGDWAGNSYATTPGCPGTCAQRVMDPSNFINSTWDINSMKVYQKITFNTFNLWSKWGPTSSPLNPYKPEVANSHTILLFISHDSSSI
ncbi:glycoside hydrolase family 16 protein [Flagelloscypha sp. PMI_526]|nr:glycoside hydrolase family 16 protein [Flagelloscypha sp. PMI_526]